MDITRRPREVVPVGAAARNRRVDHGDTRPRAHQPQRQVAANETKATRDDDVALVETQT